MLEHAVGSSQMELQGLMFWLSVVVAQVEHHQMVQAVVVVVAKLMRRPIKKFQVL
jgi:hypothetical protein